MDVSTSGFSSGGYRGNAYQTNSSGGGGGSSDQFVGKAARPVGYGDSILVGSPLARKADSKTKPGMDQEQALKAFQLTRTISAGLASVALFVFGIMILQPLLLPLFTLGMCFSTGMAEWLDFSWTILKISIIPAAVGTICGWVAYFAHRKSKALSRQLEEREEQQPAAQFSPALMARLNSERQRAPS